MDFTTCLAESQRHEAAICEKLEKAFPCTVRVIRSSEADDKSGVDYWVETEAGKALGIDLKCRSCDPIKRGWGDDVALEVWSVLERSVVGWSRDPKKRCDYVLWYWTDTDRAWLVPFPGLCRVTECNWRAWQTQYVSKKQSTNRGLDRWHSEIVFVPRHTLQTAMDAASVL